MHQPMPHFKYLPFSRSSNQMPSIAVEGEVIHIIEKLDKFYEAFGYTQDMAKAGVLPEEFIWHEYNKYPTFSACMQIHIIEFLREHSKTFAMKYGNQYEDWIDAHAIVRAERGSACVACRMNPSFTTNC
jgi:hypothetical protein